MTQNNHTLSLMQQICQQQQQHTQMLNKGFTSVTMNQSHLGKMVDGLAYMISLQHLMQTAIVECIGNIDQSVQDNIISHYEGACQRQGLNPYPQNQQENDNDEEKPPRSSILEP